MEEKGRRPRQLSKDKVDRVESTVEKPKIIIEIPRLDVKGQRPVVDSPQLKIKGHGLEEKKSRNESACSRIEKFTRRTTIHGVGHMWSNNRCRTIVWLIVWVLAFCTLVYFITYVILNYMRNDVIGNTNVYMKVPMDLPTITFCNMNSYRGKMDYTIDQMLLDCNYENTRCSSDDFIQVSISTYKCYSFNSGRNSSGHPVELFKSSKKGFLYGVTLKMFAGFAEEANLYTNGFLVFIQ